MDINEAVKNMISERSRAEKIYGNWPKDIVHAMSILNEEAGECTKEANDMARGEGQIEELRFSLIQVGAMVIRILENFPDRER